MKKMLQISFIAALTLCLTACTHRVGEFSLVATGTPQYANMVNAPVHEGLAATKWRFWILCFPLGSAPSVQECADELMDEGHGDFIERARIFSTDWSLIVVSYGDYTVFGDVGDSRAIRQDNRRKEANQPPPAPSGQ